MGGCLALGGVTVGALIATPGAEVLRADLALPNDHELRHVADRRYLARLDPSRKRECVATPVALRVDEFTRARTPDSASISRKLRPRGLNRARGSSEPPSLISTRLQRVVARVDDWALEESALAAVNAKDAYLAAQYRRLRPRRRHKKALGAIKHSISCACWHILSSGELYRDLGGDYFERRDPERTTKRLVAQLEALGHAVTLQEVAA